MVTRCAGLMGLLLLLCGSLSAAPAGLVLQLPFDGDLHDASGLGNDVYAPYGKFQPGHQGQGLLPGGQAATISDRAELRLAPGLRLEGWVKFIGGDLTYQIIVRKEREYMLRTDLAGEGGNFSFFIFLDGWEPRVKSPVVPNVGEWYHWTATWDGKELSLDVNGTVTRQTRTGQPAGGGEPLEIGPLNAVVDDVSLANPQAGQTGVAHWAFDGNLRDDTGHGHDATGPGATYAAGRVSQAANLGQPLNVPDHPDLQVAPGFRIDAAVCFDKLPPSYGYIAIKEGEYQLRVNSPGEGYHFAFFVNLGGGWEPRVQSPVVAKPGVWYRLSAQWDGQRLTLDVNGQRTETMRSGLPRPTANPLVMGPFDGRLDDLRIENPRLPLLRVRALTQEHTLLVAGQPERLTGIVENLGSPAEGVSATLAVEKGVRCLTETKLDLGRLGTGDSRPVTWTVQAEESLSNLARVQLTAGNYRPAPYQRWLAFFADPDKPNPPVPHFGAPGTTWYVDGTDGDNSRTGTSPDTAWRDFTKVNGKVLGPGERLLIKRGSVINQELQLGAAGTADRWAEIGTYGEGPRPVIRRNWDIADRCVLIDSPDHLLVHGLVVCYAGKGLVANYRGGNHSGLVVQDCVAHHIEGLYRFNAHGIPEWRDREGAPGDGLHSSAGFAVVGNNPRDVLLRDLEMFCCSWGFFTVGDNITVDRVFVHHDYLHNTSPHPAMVGIRRSFLINSILDASGGHASAGTMGIMLVDPEGLVIRNVHWRNVPDSKSHDEGGIDFEAAGNGCLVDRCTFEHNAGAAIEVLGLQSPQPRNVEIARSRFIQNNLALKLGPGEIYVWGKGASADVACSTGLVRDCGFTTIPGVQFFVNEAPKSTAWTLRNNTAYPTPAALRQAMPLNEPPVAEAGPDIWSDQATARLTGRATDDGGRLSVRWEQLEGPGSVAFQPADAAATTAQLPVVGDYLLRLVADDGEMWHSSLVRVHRLPAGAVTAKVWEFNRQLDQEGWTDADLGTTVETWKIGRWDSKAEPVHYVTGGFYIVAMKDSRTAHLLSPDSLGLDLTATKTLRLRLMNHTPAARMRLAFTTTAQPQWDPARTITFDVTPDDAAPRTYVVDLSRVPGWRGTLKQLRLELATGEPLTGTCRLDYLWLGR